MHALKIYVTGAKPFRGAAETRADLRGDRKLPLRPENGATGQGFPPAGGCRVERIEAEPPRDPRRNAARDEGGSSSSPVALATCRGFLS
ncbi:hypothetical protein DL765_003568 [Monosporascus sp. GIB2]|nr:hypothetical protein DL765_003568 [Monosporascus sp. GIB2]